MGFSVGRSGHKWGLEKKEWRGQQKKNKKEQKKEERAFSLLGGISAADEFGVFVCVTLFLTVSLAVTLAFSLIVLVNVGECVTYGEFRGVLVVK